MRTKFNDNTEVNADAFLDTVANLVGILTILFVVVAAQSKSAAKAAAQKDLAAESHQAMEEKVEDAEAVQKDLLKQARTLQLHELELLKRSAEREQLLAQLLVTKEKQQEIEQTLTAEEQQALDQDLELTELQQKIAALLAQQGQLAEIQPRQETISLQHLPTPMAKTVFGDEVHVMLANNQLSVIPWDKLVDTLKQQAEMQVSRVIRADRVVDTLGPIDGFVMNYALKTEKGFISRGSNVAMAQRVELEYFVLDPTNDAIRESLDQALSIGGRLRSALALHDPRATTVTVWVYNDSFGTFRELKERLFVEGFLTAARPLPQGIRVGASPKGSSSSAQ